MKFIMRCCSWKLLLSVVGIIQVLVILAYQGFFSFSKLWNISPGLIISKDKHSVTVALHIHEIGHNSWSSPGDEIIDTYHLVHLPSNITKTGLNSEVDVHLEDSKYGHTWEEVHAHDKNVISVNSIAIGLGITSRKNKWGNEEQIMKTFPFFKSLLPSFCKTASKGFNYNFFLAYDRDDAFYTKIGNLLILQNLFYKFTKDNCPKSANYSIHFVQCSHKKQPARAQNDAMMAAYMSNMEFYYRINDDTRMKTANWTEIFISKLKEFNPPYVGVVGPKHRGGNTAILTYDFVHFTHIHIHGFYYPRTLTDWFADRWITDVYRPDHVVKVKNVLLDHTMETGQRYTQHVNKGIREKLQNHISRGKEVIKRFITAAKEDKKMEEKNVIAFSLAGRKPKYTYGAIRNAQLWPIFFPKWKLRIYILDPVSAIKSNVSKELFVPTQVINKLILLGAEIIFLKQIYTKYHPSLWKYLIADDKDAENFVVRNTEYRLAEKDQLLSYHWLQNVEKQSIYCVHDKPKHKGKNIVEGLFGARSSYLKSCLGNNMTSLIEDFSKSNIKSDNIELKFLSTVIWPKIEKYNQTLCFDGISEKPLLNFVRIPEAIKKASVNFSAIGTIFNEFEELAS